MQSTIQASDKAFAWGRKEHESTFRKVALWPVRMAQKAVTLLSIHTTSWFVGLTSSWGETNYIALAKAGMANPYVKRAYDLIKDNWSSIEVKAFTGTGDETQDADDHPFLQVLRRPNNETGYQGFIEKITAHLMFGGEVFFYTPESALTGQNAGVPKPGKRFELIRPDRVLELLYGEGELTEEVVAYRVAPKTRRGREEVIPAGRIKHVKLYNPYNEERGFPMLLSAWRQVQLMEESDNWNKSVAEGKGRSPGFFKYKGEGALDPIQFERTKEQLQESYSKDQKKSKPGLLDGDFDWLPAGVSQKDMDWIQGDMVAGRKIAVALGVDPSMIGDQGSRTLANLNEGMRHLLQLKVLPVAEWLLDEWNHHYMPAFGAAKLRLAREKVEALQEDADRKATRLGTLLEQGLMTINEGRGELNMEKRSEPEADVLWKPLSREMLGAESEPAGGAGGDGAAGELDLSRLALMGEAEFKQFTDEKLPAMLENIFRKNRG